MAKVYKICSAAEWRKACAQGAFTGSAADIGDGFIHLSAANQVAGTAHRHFNGQSGLVLVEFDETDLPDLRWETSRGGALFPHVHGVLPTGAALRVAELLVENGVHRLPWNLPE